MSNTTKTVYEELSEIDITGKTETINGKQFLTWMNAVKIFNEKYPLWRREVKEKDGLPYFGDAELGYMVSVEIYGDALGGAAATTYMPVTNKEGKTKPITMVDIDKAIMRCAVKGMAQLGLGTELFNKCDLPKGFKTKDELQLELKNLMAKYNITEESLKGVLQESFKKDKIEELDAGELDKLVATIQ